MGSYTALAQSTLRMKAKSSRSRGATARQAERTSAPFSCPSCYDTSVVTMDCPACEQPMIRLDEAIVLSGEMPKLAWAGWPIVVGVLASIAAFAPMFSWTGAGYFESAGAVGTSIGVLALCALGLVFWGYRQKTAPRRRAKAAADRIRMYDVEPTAALEPRRHARVRGIARVRGVDAERVLMVEDESGRVRVRVDSNLQAFGATGPRRAIVDGDEVEVCGALVEEMGDTETYRDRRVTNAFAAGATVLVG